MEKEKIFKKLKTELSKFKKGLEIRKNSVSEYHLYGKKTAQVGKSQVDGVYFAAAVLRKDSVSFHFFPLYTHKKEVGKLPNYLEGCLSGKSCFKIKTDDPKLFKDVSRILKKGRQIYEKVNWI